MNPKPFGSNMLFQTISEDLNASLATADELSREFNSLLQECTSKVPTEAKPQKDLARSGERPQSYPPLPQEAATLVGSRAPEPGLHSMDKYNTLSPASPHLLTPTQARECRVSPTNRSSSDISFSYSQLTSPHQSPRSQRRVSPSRMMGYDSGTRGDLGPSSPTYSGSPRATLPTQPSRATLPTPLALYDPSPRSPRMERSPSPRPFLPPASSTLPRNFVPYKPADEVVQRQKNPARWNETDLDTYERKPHNTYDKTEWLRPSVPNSSWRESNLDAAPPVSKKDPQARQLQAAYASLPRNVRISGTWENPLPVQVPRSGSPYGPQPIISRISIPPSVPQPHRGRPIPLSVIMRLQNPHWALATTNYPRGLEGQEDSGPYYPQALPLPQEYLPRPPAPEQRQLGSCGEVLNSDEVDSELDRLSRAMVQATLGDAPPRPLSPTRLQPVVAPESKITEVPDRQELLRIRAEIPRALKRRGSVDQSQTLAEIPVGQRSQYKQMINKLFRRKAALLKEEPGSETGSSSESEESPGPSSPLDPPNSAPQTPVQVTPEQKGLHSILKRSSAEHKGSNRRARLSPLVMLLDGALVGELDTVQRAVQEMSDPSQANDEGITALHNAICGGHYQVVDFLVRIGADVSAPDSHGWTPLHCSASCNDKALCEFLVRNGAAVMAVTESDGATASQKCDPFALGFEECESFLRGVEEAMGVENSGVLYGLWGYTAQVADELSFREGDMVTILQKPERGDWWWASLCGREGFVPCNYFGLFPKVRPKSLC